MSIVTVTSAPSGMSLGAGTSIRRLRIVALMTDMIIRLISRRLNDDQQQIYCIGRTTWRSIWDAAVNSSWNNASNLCGQVDYMGLRNTPLDRAPGKICPIFAAIENRAVGCRDELFGFAKDPIWVGDELDLPRPAARRCDFCQHHFQPAAVRNGAIEIPDGILQLQLAEKRAE